MAFFISKEQKNLTKLLSTAMNQNKVMTLDELYGFLYGLAIIPEMLVPSQWMPSVFGGEEMCDIEDEKEGERLLGTLFSVYNRINTDYIDGKLAFPFDLERATDDEVDRIRKWSHGLFVAVCKSKKLTEFYRRSDTGSGKSHPESDAFAVSYCILRAVAFPEKTPELIERIQRAAKSDVSSRISDSKFLSMLPEAVACIQEYAHSVRENMKVAESQPKAVPQSQPLHVEKIGRNDPCPCGSGSKFKKCCGQ